MAKAPLKGKVKTRLIPWLGENGALALYKNLLCDRFEEISKLCDVDVYVACYPFENKNLIEELVPERLLERVKFIPQKGKNLGERVLSAIEQFGFESENVILIDTDTPFLSSSLIKEAFDSLTDHELVIGPSKDGGYYLIGMGRKCTELFTEIPWGTERVFKVTIEKAESKNFSIKLLPTLVDIDKREDAEEFFSSLERKDSTRTALFLKKVFDSEPKNSSG